MLYMQTILQLDNVMYFVSDLDKARPFYEQALGLTKVWQDDERKMIGYKMTNSTSEIVIHSDSSLPKFDYSFLIADVEALCAQVKRQGFKIAVEPFEVRCGKFAILLDMDGNEIPVIDLTKFGGKARYE